MRKSISSSGWRIRFDGTITRAEVIRNGINALRILEIVCAASIPFLLGFAEFVAERVYWPDVLRIIAAFFGVVVAVSSGILGLYKFQDNWMEYRTTCEMLKHEKYFYETRVGPYKDVQDPFHTLVRRVENLISQENTNWRAYMETESDAKKTGK